MTIVVTCDTFYMKEMNKILVVGSVGSDKSTLSRRLRGILGHPVFELDQIAHNQYKKGEPKCAAKVQMHLLDTIDRAHKQWIFEEVYRESYKDIYTYADTIIFLNPSLILRTSRILTGFVKQQLGIESCHYRSKIKMLTFMFKWTRDFEATRRAYEKFLYEHGDKVISLNNPEEVKNFILKLPMQVV